MENVVNSMLHMVHDKKEFYNVIYAEVVGVGAHGGRVHEGWVHEGGAHGVGAVEVRARAAEVGNAEVQALDRLRCLNFNCFARDVDSTF